MNENEKELNKKILKIVIGVIIVFPGFPLFYFGLFFLVFVGASWSDNHTYYVMEDCTAAQSKEIIELMELDPPHDLNVVYVEANVLSYDDQSPYLTVKVSSEDKKILGEYKEYIDKQPKMYNSENKYQVTESRLEEDTLYFTYTYLPTSCPAHRYVCEHGGKKLILSD